MDHNRFETFRGWQWKSVVFSLPEAIAAIAVTLVLMLATSSPAFAQSESDSGQLSTQRQKIYLNADGTWSPLIQVRGLAGSGIPVVGGNTPGSAVPSTGLIAGGSDGTNYRFLSTDTGGRLQTTLVNTSGTALQLSLTTTDTLVTTASSIVPTSNNVGRLWNGTNFSRTYQIDAATASGTGVAAVAQAGSSFANITTASTTTVKSGAGIVQSIVVNTPAAGTITGYCNTAASGTKFATITTIASVSPYTLTYNLYCTTGITIVTTGTLDITVTYR
ncbi:pol-like polyprotein [Asticcacaulis biprosthecium C19]|uniref:Pol-like polyprotein n=1 Tax=Asticcacaulis biprosthecium C19 TaxID=715226 RepID=F4QGA6_9CAUL|nr:hypothetical protein [Asticcacaulis biprosthecium]EGF92434.1 pol-like polyprotein [Asticcacaulis biprosthecium C19]